MRQQSYLYFLIGLLIFSSCSISEFVQKVDAPFSKAPKDLIAEIIIDPLHVTHYLSSDEILYHRTLIEFSDEQLSKNKSIINDDLFALSRPKKNKTIIGLFKLGTWIKVAWEDKIGIRGWLGKGRGEYPNLFDAAVVAKSKDKMQRYLFKKGYYHTHIWTETKIEDKRAKVTYFIDLNARYGIRDVNYPNNNSPVAKLLQQNKSSAKVKSFESFDESSLSDERKRMRELLQNNGYYTVKEKDFTIEVDSFQRNKVVDIFFDIDSTELEHFKIHHIRSVEFIVKPNPDTYNLKDTIDYNNSTFINLSNRFKTKSIDFLLDINKGEKYSLKNHKKTLNGLLGLNVFQFVNIQYNHVDSNGLVVRILAHPSKKHSVSAEIEANTIFEDKLGQGNLGAAGSATYKNRNTFRGAELLEINGFAGVEFNLSNLGKADQQPISSIEFNISAALNFPRLLLLDKYMPDVRNGKTKFAIGSNYTRRVEQFTINEIETSFGYEWTGKNNFKHYVTPFSLSSFRSNIDSSFIITERQEQSFENRLIPSGRYTLVFSTQDLQKPENFTYAQLSGEIAGNLFSLAETITGRDINLLGLDYSQFIRIQADARYYSHLKKDHNVVQRIFLGLGVPFGNSQYLPYVRQFFSGGTNGLRAFKVRSVGPGGTTNIANEFERTGDIKFEVNLEYRFPLAKYLKGAIFMDAGNTWLLEDLYAINPEENAEFQYANFQIDQALSQLAAGVGFGFRFDFNYFILRLDPAWPIRQPNEDGGKWVFDWNFGSKTWRQENLVFNFGIGYPF